MPIESDNDAGKTEGGTTNRQHATFRAIEEQRDATRFPREEGMDFAALWLKPGEETLAEVHDESLTGLGILVNEKFDLQVGSRIHVAYAGEYLQGEVRHITRQADGRQLIGLRCQRSMTDEKD